MSHFINQTGGSGGGGGLATIDITLTEDLDYLPDPASAVGETRIIQFFQDATGGHSVTVDPSVKFPIGAVKFVDEDPDAVSSLMIYWDGATWNARGGIERGLA